MQQMVLDLAFQKARFAKCTKSLGVRRASAMSSSSAVSFVKTMEVAWIEQLENDHTRAPT
jgi:hypothetical protein